MNDDTKPSPRLRWARLRFGIVAPLLTSPPDKGQLAAQIAELASRSWPHPTTGEAVRFSGKSIERWYYVARDAPQPFEALARKVSKSAGIHRKITSAVEQALRMLRSEHPGWSYQLVHDNLVALGKEKPELGVLPKYATVCRFMKHHGLTKTRRPRRHELEPGFKARERRSYEAAHVHALWHCDFHDGKRKVLTENGELRKVCLFAVLDDRSRVCCHAQWYMGDECSEYFVHGISQAFQKRGLPRTLLSDNGSAFLAAESEQGLERLSVAHPTTLAQTPEQNGKQEVFWSQVEGRLMAMLEGERELTLDLLNQATQAWVEQEYNHKSHSETGQTPRDRWLAGPSVGRSCPSSDALRQAFRMKVTRTQRRSDGTITVAGVRYELPSAYRTLLRPTVRVARWDLSSIDLVDPRRDTHLATLYPIDKERNADGQRRTVADPTPGALLLPSNPAVGIAPLLREYMADYAATGLPPAYIPHAPNENLDTDDEKDIAS